VANRNWDQLGDMQSELKPSEIYTPICEWGPKYNAYRVIANKGEKLCKVRAIIPNHHA